VRGCVAQYYFDTLFPRIPEVARREILSQLEYRGLPTKGSGSTGTTKQPDTGVRRPPSVKAALSVNLGQRAPHRAGQREEGRGIDPTLKNSGEAPRKEKERSGSRDLDAGGGAQADFTRAARSPPRGEYRSSDRDYRDRGDRRDYDRKDRDRSRDRDYDRRDRDYDRRDRDYDRRDRDRGRDREYERSRDRDHRR